MCETLSACGHEPFVACEFNKTDSLPWPVTCDIDGPELQSAGLIIYHHSQDWSRGRQLLARATVPIVLRFHNITPSHYFSGYAPNYEECCRAGESLTRTLATLDKPHIWLCASEYNRDTLVRAGINTGLTLVAPPFNNADRLLLTPNHADVAAPRPTFLFAGRFVPNKGHRHLARFADAYRRCFGPDFQLVLVGAIDNYLRRWWDEFVGLVRELDLSAHIRVYPHLPDAVLHDFFRTAHAFVCFSEHEGFCVPIIEAQAVGLPVIANGSTAIAETAGAGQFVGEPPLTAGDYEFYAELAHLASRDASIRNTLVANGRCNVARRFTQELLENAFIEAIMPWLRPTS